MTITAERPAVAGHLLQLAQDRVDELLASSHMLKAVMNVRVHEKDAALDAALTAIANRRPATDRWHVNPGQVAQGGRRMTIVITARGARRNG